MDERIGQFLNFLSVEKNASANTIAAYRNDLSQFRAFLQSAGLGDGIGDLSQDQIVRYVEHLRNGQNYKDATVARKVAAVKSFYGFLAAEGLIANDPTEQLKSPQVGKTLPRALTVAEVDEPGGPAGPRRPRAPLRHRTSSDGTYFA